MEDGDSFTFPLHRASLDAIQLQSRVSISLARLDAELGANVARFAAIEAGERFR
jgi:hypothetical protein